MKIFCLLLYILGIPLALSQTRSGSPSQPNIIWITAENMGPDLACYPDSKWSGQVRTPHLDQLARDGMRYRLAFDTSPACSPSRSAFMTGMYQTTIGTHNHRSHRNDHFHLPDGVRPITHRLIDAGYFTANVTTIAGKPVGTGKTDLNFEVVGPVLNPDLERTINPPAGDGGIANRAQNDRNSARLYHTEEWADLKSHQPFFAQINLPTVERTRRQHAFGWSGSEKTPALGNQVHPAQTNPDDVIVPPYYPDEEITRKDWAGYLDAVDATDVRVGEILAQLAADGLAGNTIVIFFADNGRIEARGHQWCYDSGERVPFMVRWPKAIPAPKDYHSGTVSERLISLIDLTATTLSFAGIKKPDGMESEIFLGPQADPARRYAYGARDRADEVPQRIRTVRDHRYRYTRNFMPENGFSSLSRYKDGIYPVMALMRKLQTEGKLSPVQAALMAPRQPDEELYDLETDPFEIYNLATSPSPEHRRVHQRLSAALDQWIIETNDQGCLPESPEIIAQWVAVQDRLFGTPEWAKEPPPRPAQP